MGSRKLWKPWLAVSGEHTPAIILYRGNSPREQAGPLDLDYCDPLPLGRQGVRVESHRPAPVPGLCH